MKRVGILGSGQLAQMMALEAWTLGFEPWIFAGHGQDPAAKITNKCVFGAFDDLEKVASFVKSVDLVTFESEFVSPQVLQKLIELKVPCHPKAELLMEFQMRHRQKEILFENQIPTLPYFYCETKNELTHFFLSEPQKSKRESKPSKRKSHSVSDSFGKSSHWVYKTNFGGYDGYGTHFFTWKPQRGSQQNESHFAKIPDGSGILEPKLPFRRELAITLFRSLKGQCVHFPFVETRQSDGRCDWVMGPVTAKKTKPLLQKLKALLRRINYVGAITFELFESRDGSLWVNEVAPRVHNSAHHSQNSMSQSQFALHLLAITGRKIAEPKALAKGFAMANLLGPEQSKMFALEECPPEVSLHWYQKDESRPKRKMGHLNCLSQNPKSARLKALQARKKLLVSAMENS